MGLSLIQKGFLVVMAPLAVEVCLITLLYQEIENTQTQVSRQINSLNRIKTAESLLHAASEIEFTVSDEVIASTEKSESKTSKLFLDQLKQQTESILAKAKQLSESAQSSQAKEENASALTAVVNTARHISGEISGVEDGLKVDSADLRARALKLGRSEFRQLTRKLYEDVTALVQSENQLATPLRQNSGNAWERLKSTLFYGILVDILLSALLVAWFTRSIGGRVKILVANTYRLKDKEPLLPALTGSDEVTTFDRAFRLMADLLAEASRREVAIVENTADVITTLDRTGTILSVSPSVRTNWALGSQDVVGRNLSALVEQSQESVIAQTISDLSPQSPNAQFEFQLTRGDGACIDILWSCYYSVVEDKLFCIAHDITERKKYEQILATNERRVSQMLNSMPVGAMLVNGEGVIETANPSCETIFALKTEALAGCLLGSLLKENNDTDSLSWPRLIQLTDKKIAEIFAVRSDSRAVPVEVLTVEFPTLDHAQHIVNVADVSSVKEKEERRREFVLNTSHELRSTLTSVHISVQMLASSGIVELPPQAAKVAMTAERNSNKLLKLINDMLDSEKLESGKLDMLIEPQSLRAILKTVIDSLENDKDITIETTNVGDHLVLVDADRIEQVFSNLLSNAIKFSKAGSKVTLRTEVNDEAHEVKVFVEDEGRGIPPNFLRIIFLRFQQVYPDDRAHGSGFGLSICKGIVEATGGKIGVESEIDKGSTFWLTIPLAPPPSDTAIDRPAKQLE